MKKSELIDRVAEKAQTTRAAAAKMLEAVFDTTSGAISEAVRAGQNVSIPGFGKFKPKTRAARKGRNPRTGTEIDIPERTVVSFAAARGLQDSVSGRAAGGAAKKTRGTGAKKSAGGAGGARKSAGAGAAKKAAGTGAGAAAKKAGGAAKKAAAKKR